MNLTNSTARGPLRRPLGVLALAATAACAVPAAAQAPTPAAAPQAPLALGIDTTAFDHGVRPQDDLFAYVNGGWIARTEIPADRAVWGSFLELHEASENAVLGILEEAAATRDAPHGSDLQKLGDFYASYVDVERIESLRLRPVEGELARIRALRDPADLPALLAGLAPIGVGGPFGLSVGQDQMQSDRYAVYVSQAGLGLPDREFYLQEGERFVTIRQAYAGYLEALLREAGHADPAAGAAAVLALETRIAERQWDRTRNRDRDLTYNRMRLEALQREMPGFDWSVYLAGIGLDGVDEVVVRQPDYFPALAAILSGTPAETWQAYLTVRLLDQFAPHLHASLDEARFGFRGGVLQGLQQQRPRNLRAAQVVQGGLGEMVGKVYVERYFQPEAQARMEALVGNLMEAFRLGIDELEWMGPATRAEAHDKLARFTTRIGHPEEWRDYSAVEIDRADLVGNVKSASRAGYQRMIDRWGTPVKRGEWGMTPQTVNAYYNSVNNEIVFPAAILQPPFFDLAADDAVNYGAIGAVIGHEISHGFDDQGRKSDGEGNLRDWWTEEDAAAFTERAERMIEQFSEFSPLEGMNVNGRLGIGEIIGDLSGLAVAYRAYRLSLGGEEAPVIAGLTGDQRFFMGWAQVWRIKFREEALRQQLMTGPHPPGMYRANGIVVHMPAFHEAFNVREGDGMYRAPEDRVRIW
jgi:putative endopeptidase